MTQTQTTTQNQNLTGTLIDNGALELVSVIGIGAYGVVYKALARDGKYYAVKCLNKTGLDSRQRGFQRREIALHTLASSHPNIVTLHNVIETSTCIYVVLSYCSDGDLFSQITEKSRYLGNDALIKDVFLQIVDAVDYCHKLGIYHRDLKPENILCDALGARVVLADFGLATAEKTSGDFGCGSTFYMSPECQGGLFQRLGSYSTLHNDVWSLGVILVNLTCGRNPWKQACPSDETFRAYLSNPDFLRSILPISTQCNELLKRIFALNPASRITLKELRAEVQAMTRWTMTYEELRYATRATKEAARAWAPAHILNDPTDAPPARPIQPLPTAVPAQHHAAPQQPQQNEPQQHHQAQARPDARGHAQTVQPPPQPFYAHAQPHHRQPATHTHSAPQPKVKPPRETVFDITDSSTVSSVDSLQEWRAHQQQQQQLHQQVKKTQQQVKISSPHIPSPATSPSVSSAAFPEFTSPQPPTLPSPAAAARARHQQHQQPAPKTGMNVRSEFCLSDSDESSMEGDDDADMDYVGGRSNNYNHNRGSSRPKQQQGYPQGYPHSPTHLHTPPQQRQRSPNPNLFVSSTPKQPYEQTARSTAKHSPPPLNVQSPRTPRQAFTAATRQRKHSVESTSSSSSSASSDASWTGLPPTPDTPIFNKRQTQSPASPTSAAQQEKQQQAVHHQHFTAHGHIASAFSFAGAKLKLGF